ncbi:MAG: capsid cement protein [Desulfobaccales bacterium]
MPALTRDRATPYREGIEVDFPVAANTKIFAGSLVCVNATGYAVPAADTAGHRFAGVAMEQVDNSGGSDGGQSVNLRRTGVFEFDALSITQAMVGTPMYASDDHTFDDATGATYNIKVGRLVKYVSATKGWIDIAR